MSLTTLSVIGNGEFDGSICCLSFSKADGGNYLCAIDETSDHNISIWDWQKSDRGTKVTETKVRDANMRQFDTHRNDAIKNSSTYVPIHNIANNHGSRIF